MKKRLLMALAVVGLATGAYVIAQRDHPGAGADAAESAGGALVAVAMPAGLTPEQTLGQKAFAAKCAACHGSKGDGRAGKGPPLIHGINEPGHHGDGAFPMAARQGVRAHHWKFGNMPPVDGLTNSDIGNIVAFVRAVQRENGIE